MFIQLFGYKFLCLSSLLYISSLTVVKKNYIENVIKLSIAFVEASCLYYFF